MKVIYRDLNRCPKCGSYETECVSDDYQNISGKALNYFEEARECRECGFDYWNTFVLVSQTDADERELWA